MKNTTSILIEFEFSHDDDADPSDIMERVLDAGTLQDAITEYADDAGTPVEITGVYEAVVSAVVNVGDSSCKADHETEDCAVFLLCFDLPDDAPCVDEIVWDAMGDALPDDDETRPSSEQVQSWTRNRKMTAYEWAQHEIHGTAHRTPRPAFTYAWED